MYRSVSIRLKPLFFSILIPLAIGLFAGLLTRNQMMQYDTLQKPALAPPPSAFPAVWTLLYILMGISSYLIWTSYSPGKASALRLYAIQLAVNFVWPILFFGLRLRLIAFLWLCLLIVLVVCMISRFYAINHTAAFLQIPYLVWLLFAAYLNLSVFVLNVS